MEKVTELLDGHFHFRVLPDGAIDRDKIICKHCNVELSYHRSTSIILLYSSNRSALYIYIYIIILKLRHTRSRPTAVALDIYTMHFFSSSQDFLLSFFCENTAFWSIFLCWFGWCGTGMTSAGNSGNSFTTIVMHNHGNRKVVNQLELLIELSKAPTNGWNKTQILTTWM